MGTPKRARYMNKLTRQQASTSFKARTRMLPVKNNYRNKYRNHTCRACGVPVETQKHVLEDCEVLHLVGEYKVYNKEIFSDNPNKLRTTATNIQNIMDQLNNIAENEVTTTPKQSKTKQTSAARQKKNGLSPPATRGNTHWWWSTWLNQNSVVMPTWKAFILFLNQVNPLWINRVLVKKPTYFCLAGSCLISSKTFSIFNKVFRRYALPIPNHMWLHALPCNVSQWAYFD